MKYFVAGIIFLVVILAVVGGAYFAGRRQAGVEPTPLATSSADITPGAALAPTPLLKTISGGGILSFAAYTGQAPADWVASKETQGEDIERLYLDKDGYQISLMQGATGGVVCLYPGDPEFEGPSASYDTFVEITGAGGELFRRGGADSSQVDWVGFTVCQKQNDQFIAPTSFGHISYRAPKNFDEKILKEMDEIITSLKAL